MEYRFVNDVTVFDGRVKVYVFAVDSAVAHRKEMRA